MVAPGPQEHLVNRTLERVEKWRPMTQSVEQLNTLVSALPPEHQPFVHEAMRHGWGVIERAAAAALGSIIMEQEMQANSAVSLWPIQPDGTPYAGGAEIPRNTVVQLQPVTDGVTEGPYLFVAGQRFFGLLTVTADTAAGWCFAGGTVKLATDAISGLQYGDTSFGLFEQDVVAGRTITGEYERHEVIEEIEFFASAILRAPADASMIGGCSVQLWDERCKKDFPSRKFNMFADDYSTIVRDVILHMRGGALSRRLETLRFRR